MNKLRHTIAVDFDGCLFENRFPEIGKPNWRVIERAKQARSDGSVLILHTCRENELLDNALAACEQVGLSFEAINANLNERIDEFGECRKIGAEEYWDDNARRVVHGYLQGKDFTSPFLNDSFALVHIAFENLFPGKEYKATWATEIRNSEDGKPVYGLTDFQPDGTVYVFVKCDLPMTDAVEIFAHELAHVAVGVGHAHDAVWEKAFDDIREEYNRIGFELFGEENDETK